MVLDMNPADIEAISVKLQETLSPDANVRKTAEKYLQSMESTTGYGVLLLSLVSNETKNEVIRTSGALYFKNFVSKNWVTEGSDIVGPAKITENDRQSIRSLIVNLMLTSPEKVQRQLSHAISVIGKHDFPQKWPNLLEELIQRMNSSQGDFRIINGVLQTAHSLFKKYRHQFKTQELWAEIKFVLDHFAKPFTDLFLQTVDLAKVHANNKDALKTIGGSLVLFSKIFYSLNVQDLPEFFEDNMGVWMPNFLDLLSIENQLLNTDQDQEPGLIEQLKSQICDNVSLYTSKYGEEFQPFLGQFVHSVWKLLTVTGRQVKYDLLVSNAMKFLTTAADRPQNKDLFEIPGILDSLCEKIIVPNMEFRESDEEMFEDDPEEFIRRDIEGSDIDTRRRAACDLVRSLSRYFEAKITSVLGTFIQDMLANYNSNPKKNWKSKDAAIYLVISMAVKGATARSGATATSDIVNVIEFFNNFVKPELERPNINELPVLKADALKYVVTFRNQIPRETLLSILSLMIGHLGAESAVVHTYAANVLEKMFAMRDAQQQPIVPVSLILPSSGALLQGLFSALARPVSSENEYVMKAVMRSINLLQTEVLPFIPEIVNQLTTKLKVVSKNPTKPYFNHYLFECIALCIKITVGHDASALPSFEAVLFPIFGDILASDTPDFVPYTFQIISLMLEYHGKDQVPELYSQLFHPVLMPSIWDYPQNAAPIVRFLTAFITRASKEIEAKGKTAPVLGVFQKLVASKLNDHLGFKILHALILHADPSLLTQFISQIFVILFQRLTTSKTTKFVKEMVIFISLFVFKYGAKTLSEVIESIQRNMFAMVLEKLIIPELCKVSGKVEKRIVAVGASCLLCDFPELMQPPLNHFWPQLLKSVMSLFEVPDDEVFHDDEQYSEDGSGSHLQTLSAQLVFGSKKEEDPFEGQINDARIYFARSLHSLSVKNPGKLIPIIAHTLEGPQAVHLQAYLDAVGVHQLS